MKFPHLSKFIDLMKELKYENQSIFPLWGSVKPKNSSQCQFFSQNCQKMTGIKRKIITHPDMISITLI